MELPPRARSAAAVCEPASSRGIWLFGDKNAPAYY